MDAEAEPSDVDAPDPGPGIEGLEDIVKREKLQRLIVVTPAKEGQRSYLDAIYSEVSRMVPNALGDWEDAVDDWCDAYRAQFDDGALLEINLSTAVFVFDRTYERVVIAYGLSTAPAGARDTNRTGPWAEIANDGRIKDATRPARGVMGAPASTVRCACCRSTTSDS